MCWLSAFTAAAGRYWLRVFLIVNREIVTWENRALEIPDPSLRSLAITTLRCERGNLEGAAAYAAFVPAAHRARVVRASVAFQAAYDYADALSEQPSIDPIGNSLALHTVLCDALGTHAPDVNYYRLHTHTRDGGYLRELREVCSAAVHSLPFYGAVAGAAQDAAQRIAIYQSLNLSESLGGRKALARWARASTPAASELRWWETAAAAGSSMLVFALIACAAEPPPQVSEITALTVAYFPWIGALHTLLDSLVDEFEDLQTGHRSLLDYYRCPQEAAHRIGAIASEATRRAQALPKSTHHRIVLAAMTSFYLSATPPHSPYAELIKPDVLASMGQLARPTTLIMRARRKAAELKRRRLAARADE
jgi:tetraprenyl-beta-curcumene synthase